MHCALPSNDDEPEWWTDLDEAFENLIKDLHQGKNKVIDERTTLARAEILTNAMLDGYGNKFVTVDYFSPDLEMLKNLRENIWLFSGYSDYHMIKDVSALLIDESGKLRSESDFFKEAAKIGKIYNRDRLRVERNHAIATSQMAARWVEYQKDIDILPNLRYKTVGDDRVRQAHRALDNIVRPIDDSFWLTYYPPNDWGCRCDVQAEEGKVTDLDGKVLPILKPMFKTNMAATGVLYPDGHPYFNTSGENSKSIKNALNDFSGQFRFTPDSIKKDYADKLGITINEEIFSYLTKSIGYQTGSKGGAHFDPNNWNVFIPVDNRRKNSKWYAEAVVYHEYGHAADWCNNMRNSSIVKDVMDRHRKIFRKDLNVGYREAEKQLIEYAIEAQSNGNYDQKEKAMAGLDTLMSLNSSFGRGHSKAYFKQPGFSEAEFIAHMFENRFKGNEIFKEVMPELYEDMLKLADDLHPLKQE